jgi:NAD+ synthase
MNTEAIINHIASWLQEYATKAHCPGFVVGVSGGIDSAVTSALCARTGMKVLLLEMPIHQGIQQVNRGRRHMQMLADRYDTVECIEVELTSVFDAFVSKLPSAPDSESRAMSLVNARARLRMTTLYYFAGLHGMLVAGTGNKVEDFGIGFFTKYGDGGVDLSPIADLNKTEVYALGRALGVGEDILSAPPTDGLWGDDRTDEDQIGASYPELEWAMDYNGDGSDLEPRQNEVLRIYRRLNRANQHKMVPIPVCEIPVELKIS